MKNLVFLIAVVFMTTFSQSISQSGLGNSGIQDFSGIVKAVDNVIIYSTTAADAKYTYSYDDNGNNTFRLGQVLDGETWIDDSRFTQIFGLKGNTLSSTYEYYRNNIWVQAQRSHYTYDDEYRQTRTLVENYQSGQWMNFVVIDWTYDAKGNLQSYNYERYNNGQIYYYAKYDYTYDQYDNIISYLYEYFNAANSVHVKYRYTFTLDENYNRIAVNQEEDMGGTFTTIARALYEYDSFGNEISNIWQHFIDNQWINNVRSLSSYNVNGDYLTWEQDAWLDEQWIVEQKEEYTYDNDGNKIKYYYEYWEDGTLNFVEQDFFEYDSRGNEISWYWQELVDDVWQDRDRRITEYDEDGDQLTILNETWIAGQWTNKNVNNLTFIDPMGKIYNMFIGYKLQVNYNNITSVEKLNPEMALKLYPEPCSEYLDLKWSEERIPEQLLIDDRYYIFDLNGDIVMQVRNNGTSFQRINILSLPSGTYILRSGKISKKFLIAK